MANLVTFSQRTSKLRPLTNAARRLRFLGCGGLTGLIPEASDTFVFA